MEISLQKELEVMKIKLRDFKDETPKTLFKEMLVYSTQITTVNKTGLELYLCSKGKACSSKLVMAIIKRVDLACDKMISEEELAEAIRPLYTLVSVPEQKSQLDSYSPQRSRSPIKTRSPPRHYSPPRSSPLHRSTYPLSRYSPMRQTSPARQISPARSPSPKFSPARQIPSTRSPRQYFSRPVPRVRSIEQYSPQRY